MMRRQEHKQQFYLWDYLWWQGEMIKKHNNRPGQRVDGSFGVFFYIVAFIIVPSLFLCDWLFPDAGLLQLCIPFCILTLVGYVWLDLIYSTRGKAVLKHYARLKYNPIRAYFLVLLIPIALLAVLACAMVAPD